MTTTLNPGSPMAALRRHLLSQGNAADRKILADFIEQYVSECRSTALDLHWVDAEVRALTDCPPRCTVRLVIESLYGGKTPYFCMASALALDEIDGTPGKWVSTIDPEYRWEGSDEDEDGDDEEEGPTMQPEP